MSRVAKAPVTIPKGVELNVANEQVSAKGPKGELKFALHPSVELNRDGDEVTMVARDEGARAMSGTMRALLNNVVTGVHQGFEKKLTLVGVGYRAQMEGTRLTMTLGHSHPVSYAPPAGIKIETPSQTEIVVSGIDKQQVGQAAAIIRGFRPPEPYKGKGVRYADERIQIKEVKKA